MWINMKLWWKPGVLGLIFLQFNAKQRNRGIKCVISKICRTARLVEWLVNSLNDTTIIRCHRGEANGNFSGVVFYRAPSEKPKKMRLEWSSMDKIHKNSIIPNYFNKLYVILSCSNTFGKLCKVNIYKLKSFVLT